MDSDAETVKIWRSCRTPLALKLPMLFDALMRINFCRDGHEAGALTCGEMTRRFALHDENLSMLTRIFGDIGVLTPEVAGRMRAAREQGLSQVLCCSGGRS